MRVTIKDIAKSANVSTATVSKVINNKVDDISETTIKKVKKVIKEKNYTPNSLARSMVTKKTRTVGLIIPDVRNPFFTDLVRGAEDIANERGYNLFFCNTDNDLSKEIKYINTLEEKQVDGIALAGSANRDPFIEKDVIINVPLVSLDRNVYFSYLKGKIEIDNYKGAYEAVKYLIELGHKDILLLSGPLELKPSVERLEGYKGALKDNNIEINEDNIIIGTYDREFGKKVIEDLKDKIKSTAIFCGNDLIAIGVVKSLLKLGYKIPEDISVVGFDDIYISSFFTPALTTVKQNSYRIGFEAVRLLIDILENKVENNETIIIKPELIVRESTGRMDLDKQFKNNKIFLK